VRRGLAEAGFEVSKAPGFGRKRDRLQAIAPKHERQGHERQDNQQQNIKPGPDPHALYGAPIAPRKVAILGAGIAGASAAHAFGARGAEVTLYDRASTPAAGASGNALALLMPRLDAGDTGPARVLIASYLAARALYQGLPGTTPLTVHQQARNSQDAARFAKLLADPPLPPDMLTAHEDGGLAHHGALILEPAKLIPALMAGAKTVLGKDVEIDLAIRCINGQDYDAIILANGMGIGGFPETGWLPLAARLGQVETGIAPTALTSARAAGHYALALNEQRLWGATFEAADNRVPTTSNAARAANNANLDTLTAPDWAPTAQLASRAGVRATTPDKLPFAGRAPQYDTMLRQFSPLRHGTPPLITAPTHAGLWLLGGLGARGFTFAPWLAEHIASLAYDTPRSLGRTQAELVSPMRFILRGLKRGTL
jgi:tRNA 5-methylaminomethyl-2-thiouridine biosynthesis bifunctional protein